jgi:parvulin-like peptidyl-prolyl cis-trans isomerase-like protein
VRTTLASDNRYEEIRMSTRTLSKPALNLLCIGVAALLFCTGCGEMVNKDNIKIAQIGDHTVTRGEFFRYLRGLSPEEKPAIHNRGDSLHALNKYISKETQRLAAEELEATGELKMPDRKRAEAIFDAQHPEYLINPENPEAFSLTEEDIESFKVLREEGIDKLYQTHIAQAALVHLIQAAVEDKSLTIEEEEYEREFEFQKENLNNPERIRFDGLLFPGQAGGPKSAGARRRLVKGEKWEELAKTLMNERVAIPVRTEMANMGQPKFQSFWEQASGSRKGQILGPIIVENWEITISDGKGGTKPQALPVGYFVCEVTQATPPTPMTLEQAKPVIAPSIYFVKYGKHLRQKYGVEIYEDKLPDPSLFQKPASPAAGASHDH